MGLFLNDIMRIIIFLIMNKLEIERPAVLASHGELVNASGYRNVVLYPESGLVAKYYKKLSARKKSIEKVRNKIREQQVYFQETKKDLSNFDATSVLSPSTYILYSDNGRTNFAAVQSFIPDARELSDLGIDILMLPYTSLEKLNSILLLNINYWKSGKPHFDIAGSTKERYSFIFNLRRHLLPIFYSKNILIDASGQIQFVDSDRITSRINNPLKKGFYSQRLQVLGCFLCSKLLLAKMRYFSTKKYV
jgi:hypothetical protein